MSCYDAAYFAEQRRIGELAARVNRSKFARYLTEADIALDFGCGGGFMLAGLPARQRIGVDVNPAAIAEAATRLDRVEHHLSSIDDETVDIVISDNALEHVENPVAEVREFWRVLRRGGRAVVVVPCEGFLVRDLGDADVDHHLFSWSPQALSNLFRAADFKILSSHVYFERWPPKASVVHQVTGDRLFAAISRVYGLCAAPRFAQVRAVALKPREGNVMPAT